MNDSSFPPVATGFSTCGAKGLEITSSSTMKMKCKSPPHPPCKQSPGLLTGMEGRGAVKQERNITLCLLDNFVRGNVTMAMGGL